MISNLFTIPSMQFQLASHAEVSKRGIIERDPETGRVTRFLEKPAPEETDSDWAVPAFYVYSPACVALIDTFVEETPNMVRLLKYFFFEKKLLSIRIFQRLDLQMYSIWGPHADFAW